MECDILTP